MVYEHNGYTLCAGNPMVFPEREIAEKYLHKYCSYPWMEKELYIETTIYEGRALKPCRIYQERKVHNMSWYYGVDDLQKGDLVEEEIVHELLDCMPPACNRSDCTQLGEPAFCRKNEKGSYRTTYETFKKIEKNTREYCGDCFRGENNVREENVSYGGKK